MALIGMPRMGKTSLLRYLASRAPFEDPQYTSLLAPALKRDTKSIFVLLVEYKSMPAGRDPFVYLYERFHSVYPGYREEVANHFEEIGTKLPTFSQVEVTDATKAIELLEGYFKKLPGIHPIFLFDDFDYMFPNLDQNTFTRVRPWVSWSHFIFATSRILIQLLPPKVVSPFFNLIDYVPLDGLTVDEARHVIYDVAGDVQEDLHPEDVEFILEQAGGHAQLLIKATETYCRERHRFELSEHVPLSKLQRNHLTILLRPEFNRFFELYLSNRDELELEVLRKVLQGKKITGSVEEPALGKLLREGLVVLEPQKMHYRPFSSLFSEYLSANLKPTIKLTGTEATLYEFLRSQPEKTISFAELLQGVWNIDERETSDPQYRHRMQVSVSRLRTKIKESQTSEDIISIREVGYRYTANTND